MSSTKSAIRAGNYIRRKQRPSERAASGIPRDDPFWEIIDHLNNAGLQGDSRIWKTRVGHMWIYWGKYGWERRLVEVSDWPIGQLLK